MNSIEFNNKEKAEKCIFAGRKTHLMQWQKMYSTDWKTGEIKTSYLVFYSQKGAR